MLASVSRDTPRKRAAAAGAAGAANRCPTATGGSAADPQLEEVVDENFPVSGFIALQGGLSPYESAQQQLVILNPA